MGLLCRNCWDLVTGLYRFLVLGYGGGFLWRHHPQYSCADHNSMEFAGRLPDLCLSIRGLKSLH